MLAHSGGTLLSYISSSHAGPVALLSPVSAAPVAPPPDPGPQKQNWVSSASSKRWPSALPDQLWLACSEARLTHRRFPSKHFQSRLAVPPWPSAHTPISPHQLLQGRRPQEAPRTRQAFRHRAEIRVVPGSHIQEKTARRFKALLWFVSLVS